MEPDEQGLSLEASGGIEVFHEHESRDLAETDVRALAERIASGESVRWTQVGIILGNHAMIHDLNKEWLGHDWTTDVVSFPLDEEACARGEIEGEVYVDLDTAAEDAPAFDATFEHEALRYVAHGLLHLIGYDDATDDERAAMRALEDRYLAA